MLPNFRGQFHLPEPFYGMKIGQLLAEIWSETWKLREGVRKQGGAFIRVGAFIEELILYCEILQNEPRKISIVNNVRTDGKQ